MINGETAQQKRSERKRNRVWHMDEKGLWDDDTVNRAYSPVGTTPYCKVPDLHRRDTIVVSLINY